MGDSGWAAGNPILASVLDGRDGNRRGKKIREGLGGFSGTTTFLSNHALGVDLHA